MIAIWIIVGVLLLLAGLIVHSVAMPRYMVRYGRKVDARVIRCEQLSTKVGQQSAFFYQVTVEFLARDGQLIEKTFQSQTPVEEESVVESRYIDKSERFLWDADHVMKSADTRSAGVGLLCILGFIVLLAGVAIFSDDAGNLPGWFAMAFGYVISILFMGVGFGGLFTQHRRERNKHNQQVIPGCVVDYATESDTDSITYYPIYEYEIMGMKYRMQSKLGTSSKKRCTIGRRVQMIRDFETGEVVCKEDEKGSCAINMAFGVIGIIVFVLLLCASMGVFTQ